MNPLLEERILALLKEKTGQLARDMAQALGVEKTEVNSLLYGRLMGKVRQDTSYRWYLVSVSVNAAKEALEVEVNEPAYANTNLAKLCRYYLACMGQDEAGISTFAESKYGAPDYQELVVLPSDSQSLLAQPECQRLLAKLRSDRGRNAMYLGYPTSLRLIKSHKSNWEGFMVEPVILFAVELEQKNGKPYLDLSYPLINQKVLQRYSNVEREALMDELVQLEEELGIGSGQARMELDELAMRLHAIRPEWPWLEPINTREIKGEFPLNSLQKEGVYNRAVVIIGERSPFTQGLEAELKQLAQLPEGAIDKTALGDWLRSVPNKSGTTTLLDDTLIEVLPMNQEQRQAVESALTKPLTIITGPPGTGKSQVVTNLLINAAWQGKKVLFASKNNKAVDVVETRVNNLGPRPVLLRLGSNQYQSRLAEYLMGLLSAHVSKDDSENFEEGKRIHEQLKIAVAELEQQADTLVIARNTLDQLEQQLEKTRQSLPSEVLSVVKSLDISMLLQQLDVFAQVLMAADKEQQNFWVKLFWVFFKEGRLEQLNRQLLSFVESVLPLQVTKPAALADESNLKQWQEFAITLTTRLNLAKTIKPYFDALKTLQECTALEVLAKQQAELLQQMASNAEQLWKYWLRLQPARLDHNDRQMLNRYNSLLKMIIESGPDGQLSKTVYSDYYKLFPKVSHLLPCWAVTSLSAKGKLPFLPAFFDLVVFDEASQCDIASALPLLYRAKAAAVIGDPKQLAHISGLAKGQDQQLLEKFGLVSTFPHWAYSYNSLFDLSAGLVESGDLVNLLDHHRSHAHIIEFSNQQFYEGRLRVATRYDRLRPSNSEKTGVRWVNVVGKATKPESGGALNMLEVQGVIQTLEQLMLKNGYKGTVGVVSPFRAQVNAIRTAIEKQPSLAVALADSDFLVDTVHKFQGDERDVMIFSTVVANGVSSGAIHFMRNNGNLFNVAITRARAQLIVVGDIAACSQSGVEYLASFANYTQRLNHEQKSSDQSLQQNYGAKYPAVSNPEQVSNWEKILYEALYKSGIKTLPQYRIEKYALDLALIDQNRHLDIEVDGERYHRNWTGELCRRDQIRNQRMFELEWDVMRFWVYEIRDDLDGCIRRVRSWLDQKTDR